MIGMVIYGVLSFVAGFAFALYLVWRELSIRASERSRSDDHQSSHDSGKGEFPE